MKVVTGKELFDMFGGLRVAMDTLDAITVLNDSPEAKSFAEGTLKRLRFSEFKPKERIAIASYIKSALEHDLEPSSPAGA